MKDFSNLLGEYLDFGLSEEAFTNGLMTSDYYDLWILFEKKEYIIGFQEGKKCFIFNDLNNTTLSVKEFWEIDILRVKKEILQLSCYDNFIKKYCNFCGVQIEKFKFSGLVFSNENTMDFTHACFSECIFKNIEFAKALGQGPNNNNVIFAHTFFNECSFIETRFKARSIDFCNFYKCKFLQNCMFTDGEGYHQNYFYEVTFTDSIINRTKFYSWFEQCSFINNKIVDNRIGSCFYLTSFSQNNFKTNDFFGKNFFWSNLASNVFIDNIFSNADLTKIVFFDEKNQFINSHYDLNTQIADNYSEIYQKAGHILDCDNLRIFTKAHHDFYADLKNTSQKEMAYSQYYLYRKLLMLKDFGELLDFLPRIIKYTLFELFRSLLYANRLILYIVLTAMSALPITRSICIYILYFFFCFFMMNLLGTFFGIKFSRSYLAYLSCGFGERSKRILVCILTVIILCGVIYMYTGLVSNGNEIILYKSFLSENNDKFIWTEVTTKEWLTDFSKSLYFSFIAYTTIGFGDYYPIQETVWSKVVVVLEAFSAIILTSILGATIIRKIIRE